MTLIRGSYLESDFESLGQDVRLVVIDFSATWCGPCKRYSPVFDRMARDVRRTHEDAPVAFLSVDVDRNQELARKHSVKAVPTTVVVAKEKGLLGGSRWKEKARFSGVVPYPKLMDTVDRFVESLEA